MPGENGRAGVALLDRRIPVLVVPGHFDLNLAALGLVSCRHRISGLCAAMNA